MKHVDQGEYTEGHYYTPAEKASTPLTAFAGKEKQKKSAAGLTGKLPILSRKTPTGIGTESIPCRTRRRNIQLRQFRIT